MKVSERLLGYHNFDEYVVERVNEAAEIQNKQDFASLADEYGLENGPERSKVDGHVVEHLSLTPSVDYDDAKRRIYFAPMATPVDESMAMRAMRLFAAEPTVSLTVFGSPALLGNSANRLKVLDLKRVADGDLRPTVTPILKLIQQHDVSTIETAGYSYGADRAAMAAAAASEYDIRVTAGVWAEPVTARSRSIGDLTSAFAESGKALNRYVDQTESTPLAQAREKADHGLLRYMGGLLRPSNLAIGVALTRGGFVSRADEALKTQDDLVATIAWGMSSELAPTIFMRGAAHRLKQRYGSNRVHPLALYNMHHAGGDDIDLHAAIMLQGFNNGAS